MALTKISEDVFFLARRTNIGVIKTNNGCILVDSGIDSDEGKKIIKELAQEGLQIKAIINTHSHADHCGGNRYIQEKTNCQILAPKIESCFIKHPFLESTEFFSGAFPLTELKTKFVLAEESEVNQELTEGMITIFGKEFEIIPLRGHSINQMGVLVDNILFCGDSFFSKEVLEKHKLPFFKNIKETKETLAFLLDSDYSYYVPSHSTPLANIKESLQFNINWIKECEELILTLIKNPIPLEELFVEFCKGETIVIASIQQYFLLKTSFLAYLSFFQELNQIELQIKENVIYVSRK